MNILNEGRSAVFLLSQCLCMCFPVNRLEVQWIPPIFGADLPLKGTIVACIANLLSVVSGDGALRQLQQAFSVWEQWHIVMVDVWVLSQIL